MKNIVTFVIAYLTLFECSQTVLIKTCVGINGTSCCVGHKWDLTQEKCIPCDKGYMGPNCETKCPYPSYGERCQMICNCIDKVCDPANGCNHLSTEYPMGLEDKIVKTELLNYEASISETCKEGYYGTNCKQKCRFPSYGLSCQRKCKCIMKDCDYVKGCSLSPKACKEGYYGTNCKLKCRFPSYGLSCQRKCKCIMKDCDYVKGCSLSPKDFSKVTPNNDTTTSMTVKNESKRNYYLKFALIGLAIMCFVLVFISTCDC